MKLTLIPGDTLRIDGIKEFSVQVIVDNAVLIEQGDEQGVKGVMLSTNIGDGIPLSIGAYAYVHECRSNGVDFSLPDWISAEHEIEIANEEAEEMPHEIVLFQRYLTEPRYLGDIKSPPSPVLVWFDGCDE